MYTTLHYCTLFIVIALGVSSGNLLSNYVTARIVAHEAQQAAAQIQLQRHELQRQRQIQSEQRFEEQRKQRIASANGRKLKRSCDDWLAHHNKYQTQSSLDNMVKACKAYDRYINKGAKSVDRFTY